MCAIVKAWLCQGSQIWHKRDLIRRHRHMRGLVTFYAPPCTERDFWAIRRSQPVQVDRLVSCPLFLFI